MPISLLSPSLLLLSWLLLLSLPLLLRAPTLSPLYKQQDQRHLLRTLLHYGADPFDRCAHDVYSGLAIALYMGSAMLPTLLGWLLQRHRAGQLRQLSSTQVQLHPDVM